MTTVIFDISMSLDGFVTASGVRPEEPLGDGGQRLHRWRASGGALPRDPVVSFEAADGGRTKMTVTEYGYTTEQARPLQGRLGAVRRQDGPIFAGA
jgi:hypothetical protein